MSKEVINLFRMTHIENVPHILEYGITHRDSANRNPNFKTIGDGSLISRRSRFPVPSGKMLGDYIPFYFRWKMPMLYLIQKGFNGLKGNSAEDIVYVVSSVELIQEHELTYFFTDGHAVDSFSSFYSPSEIMNFYDIVDMKAIKAKSWKNPDDLDLMRRKQAEFLVESDVPYSAIRGYVVYNKTSFDKLISYGVTETQIAVKPNYYF